MIEIKHRIPLVQANNCTLQIAGTNNDVAYFYGIQINDDIECQNSYCKETAYLINSHKQLIEMLQEAKLQIEYLNEKFQETGTSNSVISRIERLLKIDEEFYKK